MHAIQIDGKPIDFASRGLFIDFDGTLCDSLGALRSAYYAFLRGFGVAGSEAEFEEMKGPPLPVIAATLAVRHGLPGSHAALTAHYLEMARAAHAAAGPADGAGEVLHAAMQRGWRRAVVTSSPRVSVEAWLAREGLADLVDFIVGGDDVLHGKPDPEPYRHALSLSGCDPLASLAIEDAPLGAEAALGAGLPTRLIGTAAPPEIAANPLFAGFLPRFSALALIL